MGRLIALLTFWLFCIAVGMGWGWHYPETVPWSDTTAPEVTITLPSWSLIEPDWSDEWAIEGDIIIKPKPEKMDPETKNTKWWQV